MQGSKVMSKQITRFLRSNQSRNFLLFPFSSQQCARNLHHLTRRDHRGITVLKNFKINEFLLFKRHETTSVFEDEGNLTPSPSPSTSHIGPNDVKSQFQTTAESHSPHEIDLSIVNVDPSLKGIENLDIVETMSIPEPPMIPVEVENITEVLLNAAGEPTLASQGLCNWTPPGLIQYCLEFLHADFGLPWWTSIMIGTVVIRILVFPLVIKSQRNMAKMQNTMPEMQAIQMKMTEARQSGNQYMAAKYANDMMIFMKEKDINPIKSMLVPFAMAPIFVSAFFGLRKMANLPVESMREGGLWWFTDLTVADPYMILPLVVACTLAVTLEVGADGVRINSTASSQLMKYVMRGIPVIVFPLTMNFPAALLVYWASTNAVSLVQVLFLKIPAVRMKLKIDQVKKFNKEDLPVKKLGFVDSAKEAWNNSKITRQLNERANYDEMAFKRAGRGPVPKTYKYDPTKVTAAAAPKKS